MDYKKTLISEDAIITGLKKRNIIALRIAFDMYAPAINGMILRTLKKDDREILIRVFTKIWYSLDQFDEQMRLFTWMMNMARSHVAEIARDNRMASKTDFLSHDSKEPELFSVAEMILYKGYTIKEAAELLNWAIPDVLKRMRLDLEELRRSN